MLMVVFALTLLLLATFFQKELEIRRMGKIARYMLEQTDIIYLLIRAKGDPVKTHLAEMAFRDLMKRFAEDKLLGQKKSEEK